MSYICIDFFSFPDEATVKKFEDACPKFMEFDKDIIFVGRVARDTLGKHSHAMVWKYNDINGRKTIQERYLASLDSSSDPMGDFPGYLFDHWHGVRVVSLDDPQLQAWGLEEWNRRESEVSTTIPAGAKNLDKIYELFEGINKKFQKIWSLDQLKKAGWIYPERSKRR